jgi:peptidyl-tRNA hydrolase, PTH2 family
METKQVIVMRTDLNMRKGKMVAQGSHASLAIFLNRGDYTSEDTYELYSITPAMRHWIDNSFTKICLGVSSEEELTNLFKQAGLAGLPTVLITDSGRTEFGGVPTKTCIAIGPAESDTIDTITGNLKLL